jgi:hypothetical protein
VTKQTEETMGFEIYQLEKSRALNLLDRVNRHLLDFRKSTYDDNYADAVQDAISDLSQLTDVLKTKRTPLDEHTMTLTEVAQLFRVAGDNPCEYAAIYFASNFSSVTRNEFLYACGYTLSKQDQLLREHAATPSTNAA